MKQFGSELAPHFDYVLIDAAAGIEENLQIAAGPADRAIIVTVPEFAAVRDADLVSQLLRAAGISDCCLVVNRIMPALFGRGIVPEPAEIAEQVGLPLSGLIPYDENIQIAANLGWPIVLSRGNYIERNLTAIAERIFPLKVDDLAADADIQDDTQSNHVGDDRGAAGADEGQGDAGDGHQTHSHADILKDLE
jgi:septum site-determining protein MinD